MSDAATPGVASGVEGAINGVRKWALIIAVLAFAVTAIGLAFPENRGRSLFLAYTIGFIYVLAFAGGCLGLNTLHHLSGGAWGFSIKRILIAGIKTFPLLFVLAIPLFIWAMSTDHYTWTREAYEGDPVLEHKAAYLNLPRWLVSLPLYFVLWIGMGAVLLKRWNAYESSGFDGNTGRKMRNISAPFLILYVLSMTFAAVDWVMSLEPHWFSTLYGALFCVGQVLTVLAFCLVVNNWLVRRSPDYASHYAKKQFHDISALMFAFIVLWTYMSFAQFLIIWSGHIPEETPWYLKRTQGGWGFVMGFLGLFHFLIPFLLLLRLKFKKSAEFLYVAGAVMLVLRLVDVFWVIRPTFTSPVDPGFTATFMDLSLPVAMFALWLWVFAGKFRAGPLMVLENGALKTAFEEPPTPLQAEVASR